MGDTVLLYPPENTLLVTSNLLHLLHNLYSILPLLHLLHPLYLLHPDWSGREATDYPGSAPQEIPPNY